MPSTPDFQFDGTVLTKDTGPGGDVVIPEGVTAIGPSAFARCREMTSVSIPEGVTSIGYRAFYICTGLKEIHIPASVTELGESAFDSCDSLTSLRIPETVRTIGPWAFRCSDNLESVVILGKETSLGDLAFYNCPKLAYYSMSRQVFDSGNWTLAKGNTGIAVEEDNGWSFYAYVSKSGANNFTDYVRCEKWNAYDLELINNGPMFRHNNTTRMVGCLGRIVNPVDLTDECRGYHMEFLIKNAKKLIPIAEELRCPAIVEAMKTHGIINDKNKKAIAKLLAASPVPEIAAITL